jgi:hypothetical protein
VLRLFTLAHIDVFEQDTDHWTDSQGNPLLSINNIVSGFDNRPTNITGFPAKLMELGWCPIVSIEEILQEKLDINSYSIPNL